MDNLHKGKGVMSALKGRGALSDKKGPKLLGIVKKLTAKRKALKSAGGSPEKEKSESPSEEADEAKKEMK